MTAVIGLLNKKGIALAADSAVTRSMTNDIHGYRVVKQWTKNGSQMLRLSNSAPISIMITGNGDYLNNPWEVIIRCYRRDRGDIAHSTVENCMYDFFNYVGSATNLWHDKEILMWISQLVNSLFNIVRKTLPCELIKPTSLSSQIYIEEYFNSFLKELNNFQLDVLNYDKCIQFENYTIEQFKQYAQPSIEQCLKSLNGCSQNLLDAIKEHVEQTIFEVLTRYCDLLSSSSTLIFAGFGKDQDYPSIASSCVYGGIRNFVNYKALPKDVICISDERPFAFCPYAQTDVMRCLTEGLHRDLDHNIHIDLKRYYQSVFFVGKHIELSTNFLEILSEIKCGDLMKKFTEQIHNLRHNNYMDWVKRLADYDLKAMADLADSLIDLTGFQRILTFQQEGVGGPVDLAVITKNEGFCWLRRKSWYHHKDVNGMYGSMGI